MGKLPNWHVLPLYHEACVLLQLQCLVAHLSFLDFASAHHEDMVADGALFAILRSRASLSLMTGMLNVDCSAPADLIKLKVRSLVALFVAFKAREAHVSVPFEL